MDVYSRIGKTVDFDVVYQYIQNKKTARDFSSYIELYRKYKKDYSIPDILKGNIQNAYVDRLRLAPFDERLSVVNLILSVLIGMFRKADRADIFLTGLQGILKEIKPQLLSQYAKTKHPEEIIRPVINIKRDEVSKEVKNKIITKAEGRFKMSIIDKAEDFVNELLKENIVNCEEGIEKIKFLFAAEVDKRQETVDSVSDALNNAFDFMELVFGQSQEMIIFVTELNAGYYSIKFIDENGCVKFYQYNKQLLYKQRQKSLLNDIDDIRSMLSEL